MRVSVTHIEQYRKVLTTSYCSEDELVAQIRGAPFEERWQMKAGASWHRCLEHPLPPEIKLPEGNALDMQALVGWRPDPTERVHCDGYQFSAWDVVRAKRHLGPGLWEVKATKEYQLGGEAVTVVAKADHVHGLVLSDNKAKWSQADPSDYESSVQWRFYLDVHDAAMFRYLLYPFSEPDDSGFCHLKDIISFRFWAYPALEQDCLEWLYRFVGWAKDRGLTQYLQPRKETVAA